MLPKRVVARTRQQVGPGLDHITHQSTIRPQPGARTNGVLTPRAAMLTESIRQDRRRYEQSELGLQVPMKVLPPPST